MNEELTRSSGHDVILVAIDVYVISEMSEEGDEKEKFWRFLWFVENWRDKVSVLDQENVSIFLQF